MALIRGQVEQDLRPAPIGVVFDEVDCQIIAAIQITRLEGPHKPIDAVIFVHFEVGLAEQIAQVEEGGHEFGSGAFALVVHSGIEVLFDNLSSFVKYADVVGSSWNAFAACELIEPKRDFQISALFGFFCRVQNARDPLFLEQAIDFAGFVDLDLTCVGKQRGFKVRWIGLKWCRPARQRGDKTHCIKRLFG